MRARGAALALPAAAVWGLAMQAYRAAHAPVPMFADLDASGIYGLGVGRPVRLAVLGDSTLTGPGLDGPEEIFVAQAAARLPHRVRLEHHAVGGSRVQDVLYHQLPRVLADPPTVAFLSVGANDVIHGTPVRRFARDLRVVLMTLAAVGVETLACGIADLSVLPRVPRTLKPLLAARSAGLDRRHERVVETIHRATRVPPDRLTNPEFRTWGVALFTADRFHPNAAGHGLWAEACFPFLATAVGRAAARLAAADRLV